MLLTPSVRLLYQPCTKAVSVPLSLSLVPALLWGPTHEHMGKGIISEGKRKRPQAERTKRENHRQREQRSLCPWLEPDLATMANRSYSGLHMTSILGQGLGCWESLVWGTAARDFSLPSVLGASVPEAASPVPISGFHTPSCPSPLWWLLQRGSAVRLSSSKLAVLQGGNRSCSLARSPVYSAFCRAMSRHSSGDSGALWALQLWQVGAERKHPGLCLL